jgi:hypothetical protein
MYLNVYFRAIRKEPLFLCVFSFNLQENVQFQFTLGLTKLISYLRYSNTVVDIVTLPLSGNNSWNLIGCDEVVSWLELKHDFVGR